MVTDGKSTKPNKTDEEAHKVRDDGIALTAVGIKGILDYVGSMIVYQIYHIYI